MKSRTPSDFAIVAIFRDKRKPQNAAQCAFPLDFMGIFQRCGDASSLLQGGFRGLQPRLDRQAERNLPLLRATPRFYALHETAVSVDSLMTVAAHDRLNHDQRPAVKDKPSWLNDRASGRAVRRHCDWRRPGWRCRHPHGWR